MKKNFLLVMGRWMAGTTAVGALTGLLLSCASTSGDLKTGDTDSDTGLTAAKTGKIAADPSASDLAEAKKTTKEAQKSTEASAEYHFSLAQAYVTEGNPDKAIEEYKLTLMFDPNSSLVYARLAGEYVKKGLLSAAMETCKEAIKRDPNFIDARLMLAGLYSTTRDTKAALREYEAILHLDPRHEEAVVYKSQVLVEDGRAGEATLTLNKFLKTTPDSALVWYYLGRAEQHQDNTKGAIAAFKKSLEIRPGFTHAALGLGSLYEETKQNPLAIATYQALFDETQDANAANRIATIYLKEENYLKAVPYLEALVATDADDLNSRVKLGLVQMELKNYPKAIELFKTILVKNPDADRIHYYMGSIYEETKQNDLAIESLKKIKSESKLYSDAVLHVGFLLKQKGDVAGSRSYIQEAIAKSARIPGFYIFKASLEEDAKEFSPAIETLEHAVALFPDDEKVRYYLGSLYDRQNDTDHALTQMEEILKVNPKNVDALNYIGYTWTTKGVRLNDAENLLRKALSLKPDNGYIQDSWGWHLFIRGRVKEAVVELEKAVRLKPNEPTILEHLADAYVRNNLREKALAKYQDAVKYTEDESARKKIEDKVSNLKVEIAQGGTRTQPSGTPERMPAETRHTSKVVD